jgi:pimeloyl-ACP methyl ester carboxylesterase
MDCADLAELEQGRRLAAQGRIMTRVYGYDVEDVSDAIAIVDHVAHEQTWAVMMRLQYDGTYPAAFAAVRAPVLMLHGEEDPHSGLSIREDLREHVPRLEYREFAKCGHSPWLERQAKHAFRDSLTDWLAGRGSAVGEEAG